ncbi:protein-disulfide reductase DsbD family protein [Zavarzinella formosa]|uniref:protein-disulfide reductase DsbD family protein n=1 Tax=Zavarzinella formosa TaxID=360055 RepID=UPI0003131C50|nr:protein-disulfide reductase DsbD family protein [Zavarzinella formosa]
MKALLSLAVALVVSTVAVAQPKDAIKKIEAVFEPAEAKPGQTVSLKITIALGDGYHSYPAVQPSPAHRFNVNKFTFVNEGNLIAVGELVDPVGAKSKKDEDGELLYYPGGGTWLKKVVVSPAATAGATSGKVKIRVLICDKDTCFQPKMVDLEAPLKILDGPAVAVDKAYAKEIEKALKK